MPTRAAVRLRDALRKPGAVSSSATEFVGTVRAGRIGVSLIRGAGGDALAYVSDGAARSIWLAGTIAGHRASLTGPGGATLEATIARGRAKGRLGLDGAGIRIDLPVAPATVGVRRLAASVDGVALEGVYFVAPDGTLLGALHRGDRVLFACRVAPEDDLEADPVNTLPGTGEPVPMRLGRCGLLVLRFAHLGQQWTDGRISQGEMLERMRKLQQRFKELGCDQWFVLD